MSSVFLLLSFVIFLIWIYFLWSRWRFYKVYWQLRGPLGLPFIGLGLQMMKPEKFLQFMNKTSQQYKTPFISWMGTNCFLYVNDPETIETIFNSSHCTNKGDFYRFMATAIGDGLFTSSTPRWNKHRRLINPAFGRQVIKEFLPTFNQETNIFLAKLSHQKGQQVEIYEMLKRSVLEAACQTTMGKKMNFQNDGSTAIFDSYNGITEICVKRMLSPWLYPDALYCYSSLFKRQQKYCSVLNHFVENLLIQHDKTSTTTASTVTAMSTEKTMHHKTSLEGNRNENNLHVGDNNGEISKSKSHVFVKQVRNHIDEGQLTWQDVKEEANVIVAATFETTSTALYLVCLCLAMHPECQDILYNELVTIFPTHDEHSTTELLMNEVALEHLDRMTFMDMVINEAMRLFAPVPMVLRRASSDFPLGNGIVIPQGTQIAIDIYNMQRSERVWGNDALNFNPEKHFGVSHRRHPFAFTPFTKGLRMCIGYRYALLLMKVMLAKIFRNFCIRTDAQLADLVIKGTISLKLSQYPMCTVEQRKSDDKKN